MVSIEGDSGSDILMGGNMQFLLETVAGSRTNPNLPNITNDGRDELIGGAGADDIVFEMDGGIIDGGTDNDTLWITDYTETRVAATEVESAKAMLSDERIRIDLGYEQYRGYRYLPNDPTNLEVRVGTADQSNYVNESSAVTITSMENINATGLGGLIIHAGANDPELSFTNQQNFRSSVNMDLRGTDGTASYTYIANGDFSSSPDLTDAQVDLLYAQYLAQYVKPIQPTSPKSLLLLSRSRRLKMPWKMAALLFRSGDSEGSWIITITGGKNILYAGTGRRRYRGPQ